jgi:hypothetical protein
MFDATTVQVPEIVPLPEGVEVFHPVGEEFENFWNEVSKYDAIFANDYMRDKDRYQGVLLKPDTNPLRFPGGYIVFSAMIPELKAEVHPVFTDRKMSAHKELFRDVLIWAFLQYRYYRIETFVADYAHSVKRFMTKTMGFVHEGTLRKRIVHRGKVMDIDVYSILREEVLGWD